MLCLFNLTLKLLQFLFNIVFQLDTVDWNDHLVIVTNVTMMSDNARSIVLVFDESHTRIQTVSELLLMSCIPRPVFTRPEDLAQTKESFVRYRDKVIGQLNRMLILSRDIATQVSFFILRFF